ncbi:unnamed protein product [Somion occarium]
MHLRVVGQSIIILSSLDAISDLLDKRSTIYSERAKSIMLSDLMGVNWAMPVLGYGQAWRKSRKMFHHYFIMNGGRTFQGMQLDGTRRFLSNLHIDPQNFLAHTRHAVVTTIMRMAYGFDNLYKDHPYVRDAEGLLAGFCEAAQPGRFYVDFLPFLRFIPAWFPGADFKRKAAVWNEQGEHVLNHPFDAVKRAMETSSVPPSAVASMLEDMKNSSDKETQEGIARSSAAVSYAGGSDTTIATIQMFFLSMVLYPEVQKLAQDELGSVVPQDRLPDFSDRESLPYIQALILELLRWMPVAPLAMPHATAKSDIYKGYHIPKNSVVIANAWSILHNPEYYPDPHKFSPERFLKNGKLNPDVLDPTIASFGFGRRICPGRLIAMDSLYIIIASVLHLFNISPGMDDKGQLLSVEIKTTSGLLVFPNHFSCTIVPRSHAALSLLTELH